MRKKLLQNGAIILTLTAFAMLAARPRAAAEAVVLALRLCAASIIPALFPFFVLSGLLQGLGAACLLGRVMRRPMRRLFGLSGEACLPFIIGLTGGYPLGAAAAAGLVRSGAVSAREGERMLPFCNNTGPAFIIGAAGCGVFGSAGAGAALYAVHILAAVLTGLIFSAGRRYTPAPLFREEAALCSPASVLTQSVKSAGASCLNVCCFVVFFSVVRAMSDEWGLFSGTAGYICTHFGLELRLVRALLTGILELGGGIASMSGLSGSPVNLAAASFMLGFGSLSVHCQTLAAVAGTDMKCARHFAGRILHGLLSALITYLLFSLC